MKQTIHLNTTTSIDLPLLTDSRLLVQVNSGGGKSWLLRRILVQSHGKGQQIVIDLEGEFSTLREKYDYVLVGKGGDTPADPRSAALLARKLLEHRVSAIIDLYELHHQERKRFVRMFLESMINAPKELWHPCMVVIDEAHIFVPEKGESEAAEAVIDLATRGRKRGYCAVLATQSLSKLHKDAAAECNNKLIGRTGLDIDMKRASEELGFTSKEQYLSLRSLDAGEFFAFGPAISREVIKTKIGEVATTHPKLGMRGAKIIPPTENIKTILQKLGDLPQEARKEAQTVVELKNELAQLRRHKCERIAGPTTKRLSGNLFAPSPRDHAASLR
jgi:DNA helicase HerA-like ATPase